MQWHKASLRLLTCVCLLRKLLRESVQGITKPAIRYVSHNRSTPSCTLSLLARGVVIQQCHSASESNFAFAFSLCTLQKAGQTWRSCPHEV
ncbi:hypothetical protein VTN96DRAFT_2418 [Rasamsonia emersonii]